MKTPLCLFAVTAAAFAHAQQTNATPSAVETAAAPVDQVLTNAPVEVTATAISKYRVEQLASTMVPFVPQESPQVVDVLTEDLIRDRNATDLDDLLAYQPGIYTGGKTLLSRTAGMYSIRGMSGSQVMINGVFPVSGAMGTFMDTALMDRVELPKGPVGTVFGGQASTLGAYGAGGAVVVYQKRARPESFSGLGELRLSFNDDGGQRYRLSADVNDAIVDEKLWFRAPVSVDLNKPFWLPGGHRIGQTYSVAPSLLYIPRDDLRLGVDSTFNYMNRPGYQGISVYQGKPRQTGPLPYYTWDTDVAPSNFRDKYFGFTLLPWVEWDVTESFMLRGGGGLAWYSMEFDHIGPTSILPNSASPYEVSAGDTINRIYNTYLHGIYKLETGPLTQTFVIGGDWTQEQRTGPSTFQQVSTIQKVNLDTITANDNKLTRTGFFLNDNIELGDLRLLLGARWNYHRSNEGNSAHVWSPRAGLSYLVTDWLIPFANISWTASPNFGYNGLDGRELTSKWEATQYEGGLRVSPAKDFWITASAFRIEQENAPISADGSSTAYVSDGETVSKGFELSAVGNILRNWSVYASYAYIDFNDKNSDEEYDRLPPHATSISTTYKIESGPLNGVVLGFGYRFRRGYDQTLRGMYLGPEYTIDRFHVFDASVAVPLPKSLRLGDASVTFALKNMFNERYIESNRNMQCFAGEPRTFEIALRTNF